MDRNDKGMVINMYKRIAKFEKVSYEQFKKDWIDTFKPNDDDNDMLESSVRSIYDAIELPKRATIGSAGHDFYCPANIFINVNQAVKIPTGIRCDMDMNWVLQIYPRSGHGFKTGIHLSNSVGIVDAK